MKKTLWLFLLLAQIVSGKVLSARYEVSFGILQTMGIAETTFEENEDHTYRIYVSAKTRGVAKILSNNRIEIYESRGIVKDGRLIPSIFIKIRQTNSSKNVKTYTFDHEKKEVWFQVAEGKKVPSRPKKEKNDYYAHDDFLSLFFNLKYYTKQQEYYTFYAIGGNKKDGRIDAMYPKNEELSKTKKSLEMDEGSFLKVVLNDRIFASRNGELLINLDAQWLCEKAVLEDVLLFGDIVGTRVK
ncbi:MAG: DUF3108 domain-containing protein [Sulfuricurvum sp.]|nr:DUF3108 domain-containing protein [Sulfuricurvum sp.]